jgi:PAS domain S-box-containing protein
MIKTEALLAKLFENSKSILLVTDEKFNIRYISSSIESFFGLQAFSVLGKNAFDFVTENNREAWRNCILESNGNKSSEIFLVTPSGKELYFDVTVTNHISHREIRGMVVIMHDITERKLKHKNLEKTNDQLDHFIFKTIHDLRAPIHSAIGLIDLTRGSSLEEKEHYISLIKSNLQKLDSFINELSSFYINEKLAVVRKKIDFDSVFEQEREFLQNLPGADEITCEYDFRASCDFFSDPLRLKTILTNILSNSIKYSDPFKDNRFIHVSAQVDELICRIVIHDNGLGIDEQHLGSIFDMFFRSHTQIQGTGLGLYIVKDTVDRLQGEIEVKSKIGVGTTFTVTLPNFIEKEVNQN